VSEDATVDLYSILATDTPVHLKSKVAISHPGSPSLNATVPQGIVAFLGIQEGDMLEWKMEIVGGQRVAMVSKKSN